MKIKTKKDLSEFDKWVDASIKEETFMDFNAMIKLAKHEIKEWQKCIVKCEKQLVKDAKKSFMSEVKRIKKEELKK